MPTTAAATAPSPPALGLDYIQVGNGNNSINAGDGDNKVIAGNGSNNVTTGSGQDVVVAWQREQHHRRRRVGDDFLQRRIGSQSHRRRKRGNQHAGRHRRCEFHTNRRRHHHAGGEAAGTMANVQHVSLTGGPSNNTFTVSGWTGGPVQLTGRGGSDTISAVDYANFTLTDSSTLTRLRWPGLLSQWHHQRAAWPGSTPRPQGGGPVDTSFDVSNFNGRATLTGGSGNEDYGTVISISAGQLRSYRFLADQIRRRNVRGW